MKNKSGIFLAVFGSVFLAVGAGMGYFLVKSLEEAHSMLTWDEVDALVESCELESRQGSKGGTTYRVKARYTYAVNGEMYRNDRVGLSSGSDNIGSFHQEMYRRLKMAADAREPVRCRVNPRNPADSILDSRPRTAMLVFKMLFVFAFGGAGVAIVLSGLAMILTPDTSSEDFLNSSIRMRGASSHTIALALAGLWNLFGLWVLARSVQILTPSGVPHYLWAMCLSGAIPLVVALYLLLRVNKYGISHFEMSPMPGVLGGPVSGNIRIPRSVAAVDGFTVELRCVHQYTTRSGKNSTTHRDTVWDAACLIDTLYSYGTEVVIPVIFRVPYTMPATTCAGNRDGHYWQLKVRAKTPGIDYHAVFDVPVRRTAQSREEYAEDTPASPRDPVAARQSFEQSVQQLGLGYSQSQDGLTVLRFPACRAVSAVLFLALFTAIWSAACVFMVGKAPLFFVAIFVFFDILLFLGLLNVVFVSHKVTINENSRTLTIENRFAGVLYSSVKLDFSQIDVIEYERGMQSGSTVYYRVVLNLVGGRRVKAGGAVNSRFGAMRLADELSRMVGGAGRNGKRIPSL